MNNSIKSKIREGLLASAIVGGLFGSTYLLFQHYMHPKLDYLEGKVVSETVWFKKINKNQPVIHSIGKTKFITNINGEEKNIMQDYRIFVQTNQGNYSISFFKDPDFDILMSDVSEFEMKIKEGTKIRFAYKRNGKDIFSENNSGLLTSREVQIVK